MVSSDVELEEGQRSTYAISFSNIWLSVAVPELSEWGGGVWGVDTTNYEHIKLF